MRKYTRNSEFLGKPGLFVNPGPASTISEHPVGGGGGPAYVGITPTSPIGFYQDPFGGGGVAQRSNQQQVPVSQSAGGGVQVSLNSVTLSPTVVNPNTISSQSVTVTGAPLFSGDLLVVNKPTGQAGLGIVNARNTGTANNVVLHYLNNTSGGLTPTAAESYGFSILRGVAATVALTPAAVPAASTMEQQFSVSGVAVGMLVQVQKPTDQANLGVAGARVVSNGVLGITFVNTTQAAITPTAENYAVAALNGLNVLSPVMLIGAQLNPTSAFGANQIGEIAFSVTGAVVANDQYIGGSKPTQQTNLGFIGGRTSGANVLALSFVATTSAVTPTLNEVYGIEILRQVATAPLIVTAVTLTPAAITGNTTAEQVFSVPGVAASSVALVNKASSFTSGIGIVGYRVTGSSSVAITFINMSTATVTPPSESYTVGAFAPFPSAGSYLSQQVSVGQNMTTNMANELRNALAPITGVNLIAGG